MRRFLVLIMLCLLPLQTSWAAVADYRGHGQDEAAPHFGHHNDEHEALPAESGPDQQSDQYKLGYDHCHLSGFLCLLNSEPAFHARVPATQSSLRCDELAYPSLVRDRPERPKWRALA
ncbi:MAG: hypothetical protein HY066_08485 [Betaproteobacteria bacterium]|nr:hypothetical protein [Betaproteobacteria bacterium]